ncbi:FMN-binding protein [Rhodopirellula halodulae]|uniref:FMN-binding protein n=1 Tax=Rhodopirellula halodulae TaxID=2894198 RepID=UPI001E316EDC|nr:4Fe-4S binding protein [Rhodopirellula sp. JC737]MCC9657402.1 4Fe-4S binding protein [Rhodopirellula sp. JC737]
MGQTTLSQSGPSLPIADGRRSRTTSRQTIAWRGRVVHAIRIGMLIGLLACLPSPHQRIDVASQPSLDQIQRLEPAARTITETTDQRGRWAILDADRIPLGSVARTLPEANGSVGYHGPTEALLLFDQQDIVHSVAVLQSHDTDEHVDAVNNSPEFLQQFQGLTWGGKLADGSVPKIDGVSGATLTSLAMAGGILSRLGVATGSLVFPEPLTLAEAQTFFPAAFQIQGDRMAVVKDESGTTVGYLIRTGALVDDEIGYQGPTSVLVGLDLEHRLLRPKIRHSFDNEPYVDYVRQERSFWKRFEGLTLEELAAFDPPAEEVEGVSGATMTSMAIAYTLPKFATELLADEEWKTLGQTPFQQRLRALQESIQTTRLSNADIATLVALVLLPLLIRFGAMRQTWLRRLWLFAVWLVIGLYAGNLLSLALLAGWATSGVTWQLALGLVALATISVIIPPTRRGNPYCNHLCPHGAAQQLIRPKSNSRRKWSLPSWLSKPLGFLPAATLLLVYLALLIRPTTDVSFVEPFHGYLWHLASWSAIAWTISTLLVSTFIPMAYCRLACPTGRLLDWMRFKGSSHKVTRMDGAVFALLIAASLYRAMT